MPMKLHCCIDCGETDPEKFYPHMKNRCKKCCNKQKVHYHQANSKYQEHQARYYRQRYARGGQKRLPGYSDVIVLWQRSNPEAVKVAQLLRKAIKEGSLERPLRCELCGSEGRVEGHHNNYDSPYEVTWVCASCHKKLHLLWRFPAKHLTN